MALSPQLILKSRSCLTVAAVYQGVNELQASVFPSSQRRGGCASNKNVAKPPNRRRRGGQFGGILKISPDFY